MKSLVLSILFLFFLPSLVSSINIPDYYDLYINDFASVLDIQDTETLRYVFEIVEENTTSQIVFVSMDTINGENIADFAFNIGDKWGVGQKDKDNGIVILYVKDIEKIWVSTGYGLEGILPDSKIGRMLDESYVKFRDQGNLSEGIVEFSFLIAEELINNSSDSSYNKSNDSFKIFIVFLIAIIILIFLNSYFFYPRSPILVKPGNLGFGKPNFGGRNFGGGSFGGGGSGR